MKQKRNVEPPVPLYSRPESNEPVAKLAAAAGMDIDEYMEEMPRRRLAALPIGGSRFGGLPDLPPNLSWPSWKGKKLPFLAQIDLATLPQSPLPSEGWLFVFSLFGDGATKFKVIHHRGPRGELVRAGHPSEDEVWADWAFSSVYWVVPFVAATQPKRASGKWEEASWLFGEIDEEGERAEDIAAYAKLPGNDWITFLVIGSVGDMAWGDGAQSKAQLIIRRQDLTKLDFTKVHGACCCSC